MPVADEQSTASSERLTVGFRFDPICRWTWVTSRWLLNAQQVRPFDISWHVMSLSIIFEDQVPPEEYAEALRLGWGTGRAIVAAQDAGGQEAVLALYNEMGRRMHVEGQLHTPEMIAEAVAAVGLPMSVAAAAGDEAWDEGLRASHAEAMALVGNDVGSPVVQFGDVGFFGPVVSPAPRGEVAGRLFDAVHAAATVPGFYELKRSRDGDAIVD